jgi:hypothetical protein
LLTEEFHTREIERGFIGGGCNCGDGFVAELVKLCVHVEKRALPLPQETGKGTKSFCCSDGVLCARCRPYVLNNAEGCRRLASSKFSSGLRVSFDEPDYAAISSPT